jgi:hypothetical protein
MVIKKLTNASVPTTHEDLADPHAKVPFEERLRRADAVDHRDNLVIEDVGGGYALFRPANPALRHGNC